MKQQDPRQEELMRRTAELVAGDSDTPLLRKYLGDEVVDKWNMDFASSDERDPDGEE